MRPINHGKADNSIPAIIWPRYKMCVHCVVQCPPYWTHPDIAAQTGSPPTAWNRSEMDPLTSATLTPLVLKIDWRSNGIISSSTSSERADTELSALASPLGSLLHTGSFQFALYHLFPLYHCWMFSSAKLFRNFFLNKLVKGSIKSVFKVINGFNGLTCFPQKKFNLMLSWAVVQSN